MNAIMNKTNNGKLFAAIAVFAMLACVFAVAIPAVDAADPSDEPVFFTGSIDATTVDETNPAVDVVSGMSATNAGLGNDIEVSYDEASKTYKLTGTLNEQTIGYDSQKSAWTGMNQGDSAKAGYSYHYEYAKTGQNYWLVFNTNADATVTGADGKESGEDTGFILFLTAESKDVVRTITIGEEKYKLDMTGLELLDTPVAAGVIAIDGTTVALPDGVTATADGTTITVTGTPVANKLDDVLNADGTAGQNKTFGDLFGEQSAGYSFMTIGISKAVGDVVIQTNSALSIYEDKDEYVSFDETKKVWIKTSPAAEEAKATDYAFLVPMDGTDVTIQVTNNGTQKALYTFDFNIEGSVAEADDENAANTMFDNGADVVKLATAPTGTITMPDEEGKTLVLPETVSNVSFALNYGTTKVADISGLYGTGITISHGSIIVDGENLAGTITVADGQTIYINADNVTGTDPNDNLTVVLGEGSQAVLDQNMDISGTSQLIFQKADDTVENASVLIQDGVTVTMDDDAKMLVGANVRVNNYGSIEGGTVNVAEKGTFYSATPVNTTFTGKGTIDLSDAMETLKISDKLASSAVLKPTQNVLVNGNLTINKGEYLIITGNLEVQEGVTVTINEGGLLMVYGPSASATINGTIISKGQYTGSITGIVDNEGKDVVDPAGFTYYDGKSIDVSGTINAKKATNENIRTVWIYGDSEISGTVTIDAKAVAEFGGETKVVEGGVLNINGTYAGTILNQGTVNLNGSVNAGAVVSMNSTSAVLNVTALKGTSDLVVNDNGLYLQTDDNGDRIIVGKTAGTTMNAITLNNVKGVTVTEGYTYTTDDDGDRIVHNNLYIAGTLNAQDSKEPNFGKMSITSGVLSVSGELTIAKVQVDIGANAEMNVTGTVYVTENDDYAFRGAGELTVTGLVRTVEDIDDYVAKINAVKYEQTIENIPYYFYTSLAAAIESGEESLTVLGDLYILEDTTIPAGITVDASVNNVFVGDNERDITDITLTVANGGLLMAKQITVDATMMIENTDTGIDCNSIISDVSSTTETTAKYTNIYTALNQAQSGETVTITKSANDGGVVNILRDVEIKDGVTLVVPAVNKLAISEGVTLTNNGTLDLRGSIIATNEAGTAKFGTATVDDAGNEYAVIANNGTIVSVSKMEYGVENTSGYNIPGAYYTINGKFYITPVENAAAQIGNTETDSIVIYGKNTVGTVAFVGTVEEPVKVTIDATAEITADSMTVTNGTIVANGGVGAAGAKLNGTYGGSTGTVVLTNMTVPAGKSFTIEDKAVTVSEQTSQVTYVFGSINSDTADETTTKKVVNSIDISGTVSIDDVFSVNMSGSDVSDSATISGDVTIANVGSNTGANLEVTGLQLVIEGSVVADNNGTLAGNVAVLGSLTEAEKTDKTSAGIIDVTTLMVGAADFKYGTDVAATLSGAFEADAVYVFSKAVLDDAAQKVLADVESTEFYVEDTLWMTAYHISGTDIAISDSADTDGLYDYSIKPTDLTDSEFSAWQYEQDGKLTNVPASKSVGDYDKVYAAIDYEIYEVIVFADPGIDAVYIDGKLMTEGYYVDYNTNQLVKGFKLNVAAGEHEITYKLGNYFSGEAKMTVNGTAVTGNAFTTSGTDAEDTQVTIYLQGIEASAPETPSTGGSSDDGMGLTDYLLIILVVLIVVMAIIVALRLMRS